MFWYVFYSGLSYGAIYALLALAIVVNYKSTRSFNFGVGEIGTFSLVLMFFLLKWTESYVFSVIAMLMLSALTGLFCERWLFRPVADKSHFTHILIFLAIYLGFHGLSGFVFGWTPESIPSLFLNASWLSTNYLSSHDAGAVYVLLLSSGLLYAMFRYTVLGLRLRACAEDLTKAMLVGVPTGQVVGVSWALSAVFASLSALMLVSKTVLDPNLMINVLTFAFTSAVLGGLDSAFGAVVGGMSLGLLQAFITMYVDSGSELINIFCMLIIMLVLLIRPNGLFGKAVISRV